MRDAQAARSKGPELLGLLLLLLLGVVPRLFMVNAFPTQPVSDFYGVYHLASSFRQDLLATGDPNWFWRSPGLALILGTLFRIIPTAPEAVGRWATALVSGLIAVVPYLLWKGVFSFRARLISGLLLALWPGQIIFSGTLADDTWILAPTVALAVLATICMVRRDGAHPVWGGILYALTTAIRQEMLVLLLPLAIPVILGGHREKWGRNLLVGILAPAMIFAGLIALRGTATGRYSLFTNHFGSALVGSYVPGSGMVWADPRPYVKALHPDVIGEEQLNEQAWRLVWDEVRRRPGFQILRRTGSVMYSLLIVDKDIAEWALVVPDVLPSQLHASATRLMSDLTPLLLFYPRFILALFIASFVYAFGKRQLLISLLPMVVVLGLAAALHLLVGESPSFFMVVMAIQILIIATVVEAVFKDSGWHSIALSLAVGVVTASFLGLFANQVANYVRLHDEVPQLHYDFMLSVSNARISCSMTEGVLISAGGTSAVFGLLNAEPSPGDSAAVDCEIQAKTSQSYQVELLDSYGGGPFPGRIEQAVYVEGQEVFKHDLAAQASTGWMAVPLGVVEPRSTLHFTVKLRALAPDPGWAWGLSSQSQFRIELGE